jgi:hypothetical protein
MTGEIERILKALEVIEMRNILQEEVVQRDPSMRRPYTELADRAKTALGHALDAYIDARILAVLNKTQQQERSGWWNLASAHAWQTPWRNGP